MICTVCNQDINQEALSTPERSFKNSSILTTTPFHMHNLEVPEEGFEEIEFDPRYELLWVLPDGEGGRTCYHRRVCSASGLPPL